MTIEEKMEALNNQLDEHCCSNRCDECEFYDKQGMGEDEYFCGIRDNNGRVPYNEKWNMKIALGLEIPRKQVFPEEIEDSIMRHFIRGE